VLYGSTSYEIIPNNQYNKKNKKMKQTNKRVYILYIRRLNLKCLIKLDVK